MGTSLRYPTASVLRSNGTYDVDGKPKSRQDRPGWDSRRLVDPSANIRAMEIEVNKGVSQRLADARELTDCQLQGNYEGLFRNDNAKNDSRTSSSLFDFHSR